jgi:hypothetical protein
MTGVKVQILKDFAEVESRSIKGKDGTPRVLYSQKAYLHKGGPFPIEFTLGVESPALAYAVGDYALDLNCLRVNKFGSLEVDPYNVNLSRITA